MPCDAPMISNRACINTGCREKRRTHIIGADLGRLFIIVTGAATLSVAFASACYTGATPFLMKDKFNVSREVAGLGLTLYVLGAPLCEIYGRQLMFLVTFFPFTMFCLGPPFAQNISTILVTRFFAGLFDGSSILAIAGAMVADVWAAKERGFDMSLFVNACFLGSVIGPIAGGLAGKSKLGWRSVFHTMFIFAAVMYLVGIVFLPETYAPVLVRRKAARLDKATSAFHRSKYDTERKTPKQVLEISLTRPFVFLFLEPIVVLLPINVSFVYGALYLTFAAYPTMFQSPKPLGYGMDSGVESLPFLGIGFVMILGTVTTLVTDNYYVRAVNASSTGSVPPETRLIPACYASRLLAIVCGKTVAPDTDTTDDSLDEGKEHEDAAESHFQSGILPSKQLQFCSNWFMRVLDCN
ncbi:hypothetical protein QFC21_003298 [Naganishia friedmannii]|uniref:Uncharacterized protein n=1 Tax=Naganishia friedmannii TaxID=89922 RepID=A0ACC2VNT5_9TREE|nr:hypothetical protein QFC21_003298 [Naganishia friedmannii]